MRAAWRGGGVVLLCGLAWSLAPAASAASRLNWERCPDATGVQCATLRVPLDWARPSGRQVALALTRLRATAPRRRIGTVVFNCGGPGCPSAQVVKGAPGVFTARLRRRFDIVGFDPRATGESTPLRCGRLSFDPALIAYPHTRSGYRRMVAFNRRLARRCRRLSGRYLMHVASPDVIRDMEAIRRALHDGKLNWLGLSYGTMLGALYAERYPKRIRTMALDGGLDRALGEPEMLAEEARTAEDGLGQWARWCKRSAACPLRKRDPLRVWDRLIARANRSPIPASTVHRRVAGTEMQQVVDAAYLLFTRPNALSSVSRRSLAPAVIQALHGDASALAAEAPTDDTAAGGRAIECLEWPVQALGFARYSHRIANARRIAPHLGAATQTGRILSQCSGWPRPRVDPRHIPRIHGAPPALIVNATHDPSTSYTWALNLQDDMPGSVLLTRRGDGHTSYITSSCARRRVDRYLITRKLPRAGSFCR